MTLRESVRVSFTRKSNNIKTGPMPVTSQSRNTCPDCPFKDECYPEETWYTKHHWDKLDSHERGMDWSSMCVLVGRLPPEQMWRYGVAGDLPHTDGYIDQSMLDELVDANFGKRGFTYTHHALNVHNLDLLLDANERGLTINASTESMGKADVAYALGLPAIVVTEPNPPKHTPGGIRVRVCPAQLSGKQVNCLQCGWCQRRDRDFIVAFIIHNDKSGKVTEAVRRAA